MAAGSRQSPKATDLPKVPDLPKIANYPKIVDLPKIADYPKIADHPKVVELKELLKTGRLVFLLPQQHHILHMKRMREHVHRTDTENLVTL